MINDLLMNENVWTAFSVIWFVFFLVIVLFMFIPSDIHLWKYGKIGIYPETYVLNFVFSLFMKWYISVPAIFLATFIVYKAYDLQIEEIYNWEKNGGYALNTIKLKKQLKEFPMKSKEEQEKILSKSPPNKNVMRVSLWKLMLCAALPNIIMNVVINYFFD